MSAADNTPPWEDLPPLEVVQNEGEPVTQHQHLALIRMVKDLSDKVRQLSIQVAMLRENRPAKPDNSQGEVLSSGKHSGRTRDWVVQNAPDYVVYLDENGWAIGRWGFTAEQVAAAKKHPKLAELQRNKR